MRVCSPRAPAINMSWWRQNIAKREKGGSGGRETDGTPGTTKSRLIPGLANPVGPMRGIISGRDCRGRVEKDGTRRGEEKRRDEGPRKKENRAAGARGSGFTEARGRGALTVFLRGIRGIYLRARCGLV